jgi:hypothetical protein
MFSGPPLPLSPDLPLSKLRPLLNGSTTIGVWLRGTSRQLRGLVGPAGGASRVLLGGDLGALLRHCDRVLIREESEPVVLSAEMVIRWRAVQVLVGTPYLPPSERLKAIFPDADIDHTGFLVPTHRRSPEEVLAECVVNDIPVRESRIVYRVACPAGPVNLASQQPMRPG